MLLVLCMVVGTVAAWGALRSPLLDVDRVVVTGADRTDRDSLVRATGVRRGQAMVDVDRAAAASGASRLPWVASATVTRRWPGVVAVRVSERVPVAVLTVGQGKELLVDRVGRLLGYAAGEGEDATLPRMRGMAARGPIGSRLGREAADALVFAEALGAGRPELALVQVDHIAPDPGGGVVLLLRPQGRVRLGPASLVEEKLSALGAVVAGVDMANVSVVDLRVPSAPVLTRDAHVAKVSTRSTA